MKDKSIRSSQSTTVDYNNDFLREWTEKIFNSKPNIFYENQSNFDAREVKRLIAELALRQNEIEMQRKELNKMRAQIETSQTRYFDLFDKAPAGYLNLSENGTILEANSAAADLFGVSSKSLLEQPIFDFISDMDIGVFSRYHNKLKKIGESECFEIQMKKKNFGSFWTQLIYVLSEDDKRSKVYRAIIIDVTQRKQIENSLKINEEKFRLITENTSDVISIINMDTGSFTYVSPSIYQLRGITSDEAMNETLDETITSESLVEFKEMNEKNIRRFIQSNDNSNSTYTIQAQQPSKNKGDIWVEVSVKLRRTATGNIEAVCISRDITERKTAELEITYNSYHDYLTGLYNRRFYEEELHRLDTNRNLPLTIVIGDVNGLKSINDTKGHVMGDELLKKSAETLKQFCRADDIVARIGGDEFVLLLPKTCASEAHHIVKRIKKILSLDKIGQTGISISFGCETKTNVSVSIHDVFKTAEEHMYKAKLAENPNTRIRQSLFKKLFTRVRDGECYDK